MENEEIQIKLSGNEAIVLFDWLSRFNEKGDYAFQDQAEERVLFDLEAQLEKKMVAPFRSDYSEILDRARSIIRDKIE